MKKHWKKIVLGLVVLLALTNPTNTDFKDFLKGIKQPSDGYRSGYFLIFSTFKHSHIMRRETGRKSYDGKAVTVDFRYEYTYLGIFKNFIPIKEY